MCVRGRKHERIHPEPALLPISPKQAFQKPLAQHLLRDYTSSCSRFMLFAQSNVTLFLIPQVQCAVYTFIYLVFLKNFQGGKIFFSALSEEEQLRGAWRRWWMLSRCDRCPLQENIGAFPNEFIIHCSEK